MYIENPITIISYAVGTLSFLLACYKILTLLNKIRILINRFNQIYNQVTGVNIQRIINSTLKPQPHKRVPEFLKVTDPLPEEITPFKFIPAEYLIKRSGKEDECSEK